MQSPVLMWKRLEPAEAILLCFRYAKSGADMENTWNTLRYPPTRAVQPPPTALRQWTAVPVFCTGTTSVLFCTLGYPRVPPWHF
eukprot:3933395-Rhodomonas_salina.5